MQTPSRIYTLAFIGCLLTAARGFGQSGPPAITQDLTNLTVIAGQNAAFTIVATNGPFTCQWQSGPVASGIFSNLSDGGQFSGSLSPTLAIINVTPANAADFRVVLANGQGMSTSRVATLTVLLSYTVNIHPVFSLIANQLDHGSNTLDEIMPSVPDGCILYKFNNVTTNWVQAYFNGSLGAWSPPGISLNPGEGAFFQSPTNFTLTFTGTLPVPVLPVAIPGDACHLLSLQTDDIGNYLNIIGAPPNDGATIFEWSGSDYISYSYFAGTWIPGDPNGPAVGIGQAVWISPSGSSLPAPLTVPPFMISRPQPAMVVGLGSNAVLSASMSGLPPLSYQWYKNAAPIAGATTTVLTISNVSIADTAYYALAAANSFGATLSPPTLVRAAEFTGVKRAGETGPTDFGDMPSTNWSCWVSSYFDPNSNCVVRSIYSTTKSVPPISYPTTRAQNGARHSWTNGVDLTSLGTDVTPTEDGVPNAEAMGDPGASSPSAANFPLGSDFTTAGYLKEENGIRMIPCPFYDPTINQIFQTDDTKVLPQPDMIDPRFSFQGLPGKNLFGSASAYFVAGGDTDINWTNYIPYQRTHQFYTPGQTVWFTVEAYNLDFGNYANGVSYLNVWLDYGNSNGPAGSCDGIFQPDEYVVIDQPLFGSDFLQDLAMFTDHPYDTRGNARGTATPLTQTLADQFRLPQPVPEIGIQPYAPFGLQVVSFTLPDDLGTLTCPKPAFIRFRISRQPLNLWTVYDPAAGSTHVLDPVAGTAPTGFGYNTYGLLNASGQPDPSLGEITGGGEVEDYPIYFAAYLNVFGATGASSICGMVMSSSTTIAASSLPINKPTTTLVEGIDGIQSFFLVVGSGTWPAPPFNIEVSDTNGLYELMVVTNASTIGKNYSWAVERNTPQCTTSMPFNAGAAVTLVDPCQCQINNKVVLPVGLVNVTATDPGLVPCNLPQPAYSGASNMIVSPAEQFPDQFLFLNSGSNALTGVNFTYTVPTNAWLEAAAASQGTSTNFDGVVFFSLGALDAGQAVRIGVKLLPLSTSGPTATFLHRFDFAADQPLLGSTSFEAANTVQIRTFLSILAGASNSATLLWLTNDPAVTLQQNGNLAGTWSNAPVQSSPYVFPTSNSAQFFRLTR
jgi:hypothetical protein